MTDKEIMQMALDALEWCYDVTEWPANGNSRQDKAIEALRARLAQPEPEPVAWMYQHEDTGLTMCVIVQQVGAGFEKNNPRWKKITPLYTAPPQREEGCAECGKQASDGWALYCVKCSEPVREWQGLTDEEREEATGWSVEHIEAKLKEKNGG